MSRHGWGWTLALGLMLIAGGAYLLAHVIYATYVSVLVFGGLMLFAGIVHLVDTFQAKDWSSGIAQFLIAMIYGIGGVLTLAQPGTGAAGLTLMFALLLLTVGVTRIIGSLTLRMPAWGWMLANGILTFVLGVLIVRGWPGSALWVIGLYVALDLLAGGIALIVAGFELRRANRDLPAGERPGAFSPV